MYSPGDVIAARYTVVDYIGGGGQAEVYIVLDTFEGDQVALKILDPHAFTPLGPWAEAQILRRLHDHHILPIRNALVFLGVPIIVTEVAHMGSAASHVAANPLGIDVDTAVRWTRHAAQGVARAHDHNLLHNDIKPANLFLTASGDCLVADFGYAGLIDATTKRAPVYGASIETMAPEIARNWSSTTTPPSATTASDVYSLAATAFWMLTGQPPHDLTGHATIQEQAAYMAVTPARKIRDVSPHVPPTLARVIDKALAPEPADRTQTPHRFAADLGRPMPGRRWRRTDEHTSHEGCWRGASPGRGSEYLLCVTPGATAKRRIVTTLHAKGGARVPKGTLPATASTALTVVKRLMKALG